MDRAFKIGCKVIFFDSHRQPHDAIVTNWFHGGPDGQTLDEFSQRLRERGLSDDAIAGSTPCCNLVYVSSDSSKTDPYGRQLERQTSCSYGRSHGMTQFIGCDWAWPDEEDEAKELAAKAYAEAVAK
jgi:hypothetical protein